MPEWLIGLFARYGYATVFFGVFLENSGLPVPGETMVLAGGALAHFGHLSLGWVIASSIVGATLGDNLGFVIGRHGGRRLVERHGWRIGVSRRRLAGFDRFFERHGPRAVFAARFIAGLRLFCAILAGASDMPWRTFLFFNATGAVVWSMTIAGAGYLLGQSWEALERWVGRAGVLGLAAAAGLLALWIRRLGRAST